MATGEKMHEVKCGGAVYSVVYSPNGTYDAEFLANYAYININDPMTRVNGVGQVNIYGAGQYAMRFWVEPDKLAQMKITVPDIMDALKQQNTEDVANHCGMTKSTYTNTT